jgi:hypothetical protein
MSRPTAGLPLSVGSASLPLRLLIASIFVAAGALCIGGGVFAGRTGVAGAAVAIALIVPLGLIAAIAAAFVIAPFSRFGVWLDEFVGRLTVARFGVVLAILWAVAALFVSTA